MIMHIIILLARTAIRFIYKEPTPDTSKLGLKKEAENA